MRSFDELALADHYVQWEKQLADSDFEWKPYEPGGSVLWTTLELALITISWTGGFILLTVILVMTT